MGKSITDARHFDTDPLTGAEEFYYFDPETEGFVLETRQDLQPMLEHNKALWNATETHTPYSELQRVASIPTVVVLELAEQGIMSAGGVILDQDRMRRWLNDRDNLLFRVRAGKI